MSNTTDGPEPVVTPNDTNANDGDGKPVDKTSDLFDGIPDDHPVRGEVTKLRNENASRRQSVHEKDSLVTELTTKLEGSKTAEELQTIVSEYDSKLTAKQLELDRKTVASELSLPGELAARLAGNTIDELRADGTVLAEYFKGRKPAPLTPAGGSTPKVQASDAKAVAERIRANRR